MPKLRRENNIKNFKNYKLFVGPGSEDKSGHLGGHGGQGQSNLLFGFLFAPSMSLTYTFAFSFSL